MEHPAFSRILSEPRSVRWIWFVYLLLYAIAIPWYWPEGYVGPIVMGLPLWVAVTLLAVVALACWTVFVIYYFWQTVEEEED